MKVLVRLDSLIFPRTGIGYYTEHLIRELFVIPNISLCGLYQTRRISEVDLLPLLEDNRDNREKPGLIGQFRTSIRGVPGAYRTRQVLLDWRAAQQAKTLHADLYHEPSFIPVCFGGPLILTVHDLSHWRHPQYHPTERVDFLTRYLPRAVERASSIITVSEFARQEFCELFPEASERTCAVHNGVDEDFHPRSVDKTHGTLSQWKLTHGSYILSVATLEPRKNLTGLVHAYKSLPQHIRRDTPLVLAGGKGWKNRELNKLLAALGKDSRVILTGRVPRADLANLVSGAKLFAYPSFYEGFGLPIAEARASGIPVLTSDRGAMKEVAGDDAFLVDPDSNFADELQTALEWAETHQVEPYRYSWTDTAKKTVEVYRKVL